MSRGGLSTTWRAASSASFVSVVARHPAATTRQSVERAHAQTPTGPRATSPIGAGVCPGAICDDASTCFAGGGPIGTSVGQLGTIQTSADTASERSDDGSKKSVTVYWGASGEHPVAKSTPSANTL